jgi:GNAT superfamily N-acetyltransferase
MGDVSATEPLSRPEHLADYHDVEGFNCGEPSLDNWLIRRAKANQASGASRTYVVCRGNVVVGFYALAAGGIAIDQAPGRLKRNMPDPIPAVVLGRLAIMRSEQGTGLGRALLRDAMQRIALASEQVGIALVLVHALSEQAKRFYLAAGFSESPLDPMVLSARTKDVSDATGG